MKTSESVPRMKRHYAKLTAHLAKLGPILQGTITERTIERDDPENPGEKKAYGPYFQWTWKRDGKTVTVNLSAAQAKAYQKAIDNHRRLENILGEMRDLSLAILEQTTEGVIKRNRNK